MIDRRIVAMARRLWRQHRLMLAIMAAALALFEFVITRIAPTPGDVGFLGGLLALLPRQIVGLVGGELALGSPGGVIAFGYLHPFFLTLFSAWTIRVASGALAGEIGRGTMDLLAARPVPRWAHVIAAWLVIGAGLVLLAAAAWGGTAIGLQMRSLGVSPRQVIGLPILAWLLFMSWGGVAMLISATQRDAGAAIAWTSGIIATSFVLDFVARLWEPVTWTRPLSLFAYYDPASVVRNSIAAADVVPLVAVAAVAIAGATITFHRRDL